MSSIVEKLAGEGLIEPPPWMPSNMMFESITGSYAYGCNEPGSSDEDIVGFCIPPKHMIFPHLAGHIPGFGNPPPTFGQFQQHHIEHKGTRKQYDMTIYGIVKFFSLCMDNNPNMVDALFVPRRCVKHSTAVYERVRDNRKLFLHKGSWHRFRGYAYAQLSKLDKGANKKSERRQATIEKHGFDTKFAYHIVRLALECEQILETGDLVLDRDRNLYKGIRNGEWTKDELREWFADKEKDLENLYRESDLRIRPDEEAIRGILLECLEMHYGSLKEAVRDDSRADRLVSDLQELVAKYG